ncbi:MAG: hypothetical protein EA374_06720 [Acholeplasmatales bacterium]|nr:MAG: hypothetical protein EA374_06720 [Acholeplasmatales bacterium]
MTKIAEKNMRKIVTLALKKTEEERHARLETGLRHVPTVAQLKTAKALKKALGQLDDDDLLKVYGWMQLGKQGAHKNQAQDLYTRVVARERAAFDRERLETALVSCHALSEAFDVAFNLLGSPFFAMKNH